MAATDLQVFQYVVALQPKYDSNGNVVEDGQILVKPTTVLASDQSQAAMLAARAIPEAQVANIARLTVVVRPF